MSTQLAKHAALPSAQILQNRCVVCGFWTPDFTKVKSHIRQAHPRVWQEACLQAEGTRQEEAPSAMRRPFSGLLVLATDTPPT